MGQPKPTLPKVHFRTVDLRANQNGTGFSGYASHFWSADSYWSAVKPGAFKKTLNERAGRIPVLWQHDTTKPIGKPNVLKEDKTGLYFDAAISEATTVGKDAMALLRDDVPMGVSFGFQTIKSRQGTEDDPIDLSQVTDYKLKNEDIWIIEEAKLFEVSLVTFPANEHAVINDVRAANEAASLTSLLDALKAGTLSDEQRALCAELVAAFTALKPQPDHSGTTALDAANARRRTIDITLALAAAQAWTGAA